MKKKTGKFIVLVVRVEVHAKDVHTAIDKAIRAFRKLDYAGKTEVVSLTLEGTAPRSFEVTLEHSFNILLTEESEELVHEECGKAGIIVEDILVETPVSKPKTKGGK